MVNIDFHHDVCQFLTCLEFSKILRKLQIFIVVIWEKPNQILSINVWQRYILLDYGY